MSKKPSDAPSSFDAAPTDALQQRRQLLRSMAASAGLAALGSSALTACGGGDEGSADGMKQALAAPKTKIDVPVISCVPTGAQASITVQVCAGATGLPAGFSLQWMTQADFIANGGVWYASDDLRLCKASFSGNASDSRYLLAPGACTTVTIGDTLLDNGASTNCPDPLLCGAVLVIHAFGHATSKLQRSDFSGNLVCSAAACSGGGGCTYTQGYWKTHGSAGPASTPIKDELGVIIGYVSVWPVSSLSLGTVSYTEAQLQTILDKPAAGNGLITLAHQLIAAKLNIAGGADDSAIAGDIAAADAMIGGLVVPPIGSGALTAGATAALVASLTAYNEGATGPGHCPA